MLPRLECITPNTLEFVVRLNPNQQVCGKLLNYLVSGGTLIPTNFTLDTFKGKMVTTCSISLNSNNESVVRVNMTPAIAQLYHKDFNNDINHLATLFNHGDFNYDALWQSPSGDPTDPNATIHSLSRVSVWLN